MPGPSLRTRAGTLVYDWPRFLLHLGEDWTKIRNRNERLTTGARGARCEWLYTSELHLPNVHPWASAALLRRTLRDWPIVLRDSAPAASGPPAVSFLIGHRGTSRLPNLLQTLRSIAGQTGTSFECIVIEQSAAPEIRDALPPWVRYVHTPVAPALDYCRAKTFNDGLRAARGEVLIFHDNDFLVPAAYASEVLARAREGHAFIDVKRFMFYPSEADTRALFASGTLDTRMRSTVVQNLKGGSIAATAAAYRAIGGYDESFVGWGGEDLELWERARAFGRVYEFGYLPLVHLWHAPQPGKLQGNAAPAQQRYFEQRAIAVEERIARLRSENFPDT
jgi:hypothetical protein